MSQMNPGLKEHLATGVTTVAHAWAIARTDGVVLGFTDHDRELSFDGITFRADTGLSALSLAQSTGMSVDNTEALGALSDISIREDEIEQGRFDDASIQAWLVNWNDVSQRWLQFRGTIGEVSRGDGGFRAELRGLTQALNRPQGRVYQKPCGAVLGDRSCGVNLWNPSFSYSTVIAEASGQRQIRFSDFPNYVDGWFTRGRLEVIDGEGAGLSGAIKQDVIVGADRVVALWEPLRCDLAAGTSVRLVTGCDKRGDTCRNKFGNYANFQGFPDVPNEDWLLAVPKSNGTNTGGSRR